jgi:hypothetical protein
MAFRSLVRRKTQLALLATACERREPARVVLRDSAHPDELVDSQLLALQGDGLLLDWSGRPVPSGRVQVRFELAGEEFVLEARTHEAATQPGNVAGRDAVKLAMPFRLQRREPRRAARMGFAGRPPISAVFHGVSDDRLCFDARLEDISTGGFSVISQSPVALEAAPGTLCWSEFSLPESAEPFEFVVRLVHTQRRGARTSLLGWAFQPADDDGGCGRHLARLASYLGCVSESAGTEEK